LHYQNSLAHEANYSFEGHHCYPALATPFFSNFIPPPIFNYQPKHTFVLDMILFAQALAIVPHLSLGGLFGMVYECLSKCFILKDPSLGFLELF
jgi:hypothetical protein